ncbi:MAG: YHYH domain-containing protein [Nitrospirae bacterium]|nr:YHYH domain-containing protein [Nitrospirota bacterium]
MIKSILSVVATLLFICSIAFAHGGRTDACGGHRDRKHGGYHVHNYEKYCACHPEAPECKSGPMPKKSSRSKAR